MGRIASPLTICVNLLWLKDRRCDAVVELGALLRNAPDPTQRLPYLRRGDIGKISNFSALAVSTQAKSHVSMVKIKQGSAPTVFRKVRGR